MINMIICLVKNNNNNISIWAYYILCGNINKNIQEIRLFSYKSIILLEMC